MERGYSVRAVQGLPPTVSVAEIERIADSGFSSLSSLVIAEAAGGAPHAVRSLLTGPRFCETWLCVLMHVHANLSHSMAGRFLMIGQDVLQDDPQYRRMASTRSAVKARMQDARKRVSQVRERQEKEMMATLPRPKQRPGMEAFMAAQAADYEAVLREVTERSRVSSEVLAPPPSADSDPEWAIRNKVIKEEVDDAVRDLLLMSDVDFAERVGDDIRDPAGADSALRHPLLLTRWAAQLERIGLVTLRALGYPQEHRGGVSDDAWFDLPANPQGARQQVNRMRFLEGVEVRKAEHAALMDSVARQIRYGIRRQQILLEERVRDALAERFEVEIAMYAALTA